MSYTRVLIFVGFAAALAFAAAFLLRGGGDEGAGSGDEAAGAFLFDPAKAIELSIEYFGEGTTARTERLIRTTTGGGAGWNVHWTDLDGGAAVWPAAGSQIRGALRILSTLEVIPAEGPSEVNPAAELRIRLEDGPERVLRLSGRALSGRVLAEIGTAGALRPAWLDRSVLEILVGTGAAGPRAWRDQSALPGTGAEVSRVTLEGGGTAGTLAIARVQGRWALRQPLAEVAEPDAITKLFTSLADVRIMDFLDEGDAAGVHEASSNARGLDEPIATLTLESDLRDGSEMAEGRSSASSVLRRTLAVGHTADLAGRNVFARVRQERITGNTREVLLDRVVIVSGEALAAIAMDPAAYISRRTFSLPAADVGGVVVRIDEQERAYERTLDGWRRQTREGLVPLPREEAEGLASMLHLVMQGTASRVVLTETTDPVAAAVHVTTLGGTPVGEATLVVGSEGASVGVYSRGVMRVHDAQASQPVLRWLLTLK